MDTKEFKNYYVMSMEEFLYKYVGINAVDNLSKLNHYDLNELNIPYIKRVPYASISSSDVISGRVLLVKASGFKGKGTMICAYLRPSLIKENGKGIRL